MTARKIAAALALLALAGCSPYDPGYSDYSGYYANRAYDGGPDYYGSTGYGYAYGGEGSYRFRQPQPRLAGPRG
jgi:hypothetical protein